MMTLKFPLIIWLIWLETPILNKIPNFWTKIIPVDGGDGAGGVVHIVMSMFLSYITLVVFISIIVLPFVLLVEM